MRHNNYATGYYIGRMVLACLLFNSISIADSNLIKLAKKTSPAVVLIETFNKNSEPMTQGTGFFITAGGWVVTNHHVIEGAYSAIITTMSGEQFPIEGIIAKDTNVDITVLSINLKTNTGVFLELVDILPAIGEDIAVVGNPLGLESTVSEGIVSGIREIPAIGHILQISAPISQGSSGSPVLNMKGQVVGVATLLISEGQALNFAIPSEKIIGLKMEAQPIKLSEYASVSIDGETEELCDKGWQKILEEEWLEALNCFENATRRKPNYESANLGLGLVYSVLNREKEAIIAYERVVALNPDDADNQYLLGAAYDKLDFHEKAIDAYNQAISLNPDYSDAYHNLGVIYTVLGNYEEALKKCKQALNITQDEVDTVETHGLLGLVYNKLERYEEAIPHLTEALRIKPDYALAHLFRGEAYLATGYINLAMQEYKTLKLLDEESATQLFTLICGQKTSLPSGDTDTSKSFLYHDSQWHFSLTVPAGWEEIPEDIINEYYKAMEENAVQKITSELEYKAAFQKINTSYFACPHISFAIDNSGKLPQCEIKEFLFSEGWKEAINSGLKTAENALSDLIQNSTVGQTQYDENKKIIFLKIESEVIGVGNISILVAMFLSNYGNVNMYCCSLKENFEDDLPYFTQIIDSFKFDAGYTYDLITKDAKDTEDIKDNYPIGNNSGDSLRNTGLAVFTGCILVTIIIIVIARKSTEKTNALTEKVTQAKDENHICSPAVETLPKEEDNKIGLHEFKSDISASQEVSEKNEDSAPVILGYFQECANCTRTIGKLEHSYKIEGNVVCVKCYQRLTAENN